MTETVLGIIDAQRGFMPAEEGKRLGLPGFGELPVTDGEQIIPVLYRMIGAIGIGNTFTTQDWHPNTTAHFSDNPNFVTNWPVHCVGGMPGAELHPDLEARLTPSVTRFFKGQECLDDGKDDLSYSGYYGTTESGLTLPDWLRDRQVNRVYLGGLALDYCVGKTAIDLRNKQKLDVTVILDATRGIAEPSMNAMLETFREVGVKVIDSDKVYNQVHQA